MSSFSMFQSNEPDKPQANGPAEQPAKPAAASVSAAGNEDSVIDSELVIIGDVKSSGGVRVDGTIRGDLNCATLVVSEGGAIEGNVGAKSVVIHGRVSGSIRGRSVMLHATAKVEADIEHQGIGIEMGTHYDGTLKWVDDEQFQA